MSQSGKFLCLFLTSFILFSSCKKEKADPNAQGKAEFSVSVSQLKSFAGSSIASNLGFVVVSIEDENGKVIKNLEKVELLNMNGSYISTPLSLVAGKYKLTQFLVLDKNSNIVYAAPLAGSAKAYLVEKPLSIAFTIGANSVVKVVPEVLSAIDSQPEDFGYATFGFQVAQTFDFLLGVFVYDNTAQNFGLTTAQLKITSNATVIYEGALNAYYSEGSAYDTLAITNKITLPERYSTYTIQVSKSGYGIYSKTLSKEDLRKYFLSEDNGPLVVILEKSQFSDDGLVAYYKFDYNARDSSGMGNHGIIKGNPFKEYGGNWCFNNTSSPNSYIEVPNNASLNMLDAISVTAWINTIDHVGTGHDPIVNKPFYSHIAPYYQYSLGITGDYWNGYKYNFRFSISIEGISHTIISYPTQWSPGNWYFVVASYDGYDIRIYVNGIQCGSLSVSGKINNYGQNLLIGYGKNGGNMYGGIDEVRIYNRALSQAEISNLYNE